ncbi:hypothetical protein HYH03_001486 [Edaphochlamys debaryana]|uniref:Uncharacterized protein n=1 Tax=Edaphochlamys debaryana TaxID=47281 RepID=A0A835YGW3_9CHLO|nr:hypothetical protein HYH03_001486 [Edaphochlamys debaryana]|eukprot:KAG2500721.1 hypothetical protein HYH03_001486 [Edaphochlamys debaryana]
MPALKCACVLVLIVLSISPNLLRAEDTAGGSGSAQSPPAGSQPECADSSSPGTCEWAGRAPAEATEVCAAPDEVGTHPAPTEAVPPPERSSRPTNSAEQPAPASVPDPAPDPTATASAVPPTSAPVPAPAEATATAPAPTPVPAPAPAPATAEGAVNQHESQGSDSTDSTDTSRSVKLEEARPVEPGAGAAAPAPAAAAGSGEAKGAGAGAPGAGLEELRVLLAAARQAVAALEAAVASAEQRVAGLAAAAAVGAAAAAGSDPAAAVLHSLGLDASTSSAPARAALRLALQQLLREREAARGAGAVPGAATPGLGLGLGLGLRGAHPVHATLLPPRTEVDAAAADAAAATAGHWFGHHFAMRSALRLGPGPPPFPPPPSPPPPSAPAPDADAAGSGAAADGPSPSGVVTCAFAFELPNPNTQATGGGALVYIVAGDAAGGLYLLRPVDGAVLAAVPTGTDSPVTACTAYFTRRLESVVVTGHANGQTRSFAVSIQDPPADPDAPGGGSHHKRKPGISPAQEGGMLGHITIASVTLRHVVESMPPAALPWPAVEELIAPGAGGSGEEGLGVMAGDGGATEAGGAAAERRRAAAAAAALEAEVPLTGPPAPIMHLLPYKLGNKASGRRHVLVLDRAGNVRLDRENGTSRYFARTNRTQLAVRFAGTYAVMLSAHHATLVNTLQPRAPRAFACQHLNGSRLLTASFDGSRVFRGYGVNTRGELLSLVTPHEGRLTACKVHKASPLPWLDIAAATSRPSSLLLTPMRGYLLLTHGTTHVVFNVTGVLRSGLPFLAAVGDGEVAGIASHIAITPPPPSPPGNAPAQPSSATSSATSSPASSSYTRDAPGPGSGGLPAFSGGLINGLLPPPPVVAVGQGSQVLILGVGPEPLPSPDPSPSSAAPGPDAPGGPTQAQAQAQAGPLQAPAAGLVVVLESRLPRMAPSAAGSKVWSQPIFIGAILIVGLYQFWRMSNTRSQQAQTQALRGGPRGPLGGFRPARGRRGMYGPGYGDTDYAGLPMQPRSALRGSRPRTDRPARSVSYADEDDEGEY